MALMVCSGSGGGSGGLSHETSWVEEGAVTLGALGAKIISEVSACISYITIHLSIFLPICQSMSIVTYLSIYLSTNI